MKVISRTRSQERKPATQRSTARPSDVKAIFSPSSSQHRPALVKQHGLPAARDQTLVRGRHQLKWLPF